MAKSALIVDDSTTARLLLSKVLRNMEIHCRETASGEDALRILKTYRPDFIFLDHIMPGMDGFQVLKQIKSNTELCKIPVIMYTSQNALKYYEEAHALGATGVISKQIDREKLYLMIDRLCLNAPASKTESELTQLLHETEEDLENLAVTDPKLKGRISTLESAYEALHEEIKALREENKRLISDYSHSQPPSASKRWISTAVLTSALFLAAMAWHESYQFEHLLLQLSGQVNVQHDLIKEIINLLDSSTR